jgi:hypothetical protein
MGQWSSAAADSSEETNSYGVAALPPTADKEAVAQATGTDVTYHVDDLLKHTSYALKFSPTEVIKTPG